jgi:hypothetical protein
MVITFWDTDECMTEKTYTTIAEQVIGYINMIDTVKAGGYCLATVGNKSQLVTCIKQLLPPAKKMKGQPHD